MRSFWRIFSLELLSLVRSKALAMLVAAGVGWMLIAPYLIRSDGTAEGSLELNVRYSLGGVFALLLVALLSTAAGSLARERAAKLLQLTLVRPVSRFSVVFARAAALTTVGAAVLGLAALVLAFRADLVRPSYHVLRPILPSAREEARAMYEDYMKDSATPAEVRRAPRAVVLRLLENRAIDHYQTIPTNAVASWRFRTDGFRRLPDSAAVRIRFTNSFELRQDVRGEFVLGAAKGIVSNITQAVLSVPLGGVWKGEELLFSNRGTSALMMRPRKDLELRLPADAFGWNLLRAYLEMVAVLSLVISFGLFLSASLSRPVALFVAVVTLLVSEMSPSVIAQYPDELETKTIDRLGLVMTRFAAEVTRPVASLEPLERLATDSAIEWGELARVLSLDLVLVPLFLSLLAALVLPRKQDNL